MQTTESIKADFDGRRIDTQDASLALQAIGQSEQQANATADQWHGNLIEAERIQQAMSLLDYLDEQGITEEQAIELLTDAIAVRKFEF